MEERILSQVGHYNGPCLLYDLQSIKRKMQFFADLGIETNINFLFTIKSFPFPEVIELAKETLLGFEISNINECQLLPSGLSGVSISVNDPCLAAHSHLPEALYQQNDCYIHLDRLPVQQGSLLKSKNIFYGIRISHTSLIDSTNHPYVTESRFGISLKELFLLRQWNRDGTITGLHVHNGSEDNDVGTYLLMLDHILSFIENNNIKISFLNFGGGLHNMTEQAIVQLMQAIAKIIHKKNIKCFFEPGLVIASNAGYAVAKIMSLKQAASDKYFITLDISNECHLKWSFPKLISKRFDRVQNSKMATVFMGGPTCYEHDFIGAFEVPMQDRDQPFQEGDLLVFEGINGYSAAWNTGFNGIRPAGVKFQIIQEKASCDR